MPEKTGKPKDKSASGAAIAAGGGVVGGVGLAAGGVPGAKSDFSVVLNDKKGVRNKVRVARAAPGGILGFRSSAHRGGLYGFAQDAEKHEATGAKTAHEAFFQGRNAGKIAPEKEILRHMGRGRGAAATALVGGGATTAYGLKRSKGEVKKSQRDSDKYHGTLIGAGAAGAGVSHGTSRLLRGQGRKWEGRASASVDDAGRMVPKIAGRQGKQMSLRQMHKYKTKNPGKDFPKSMYPKVSDGEIKRNKQILDGVSQDTARRAGELRGAAAQQRHFAEVYSNTSRVVGRLRTPSAIVAGAGAGGLLASRKKDKVSKSELMSDAEIKRRKKAQATLSNTTGALGLAALGGTLAASRGGRTQLRKIPQLKSKIAAPPPKDPDRDRIRGAVTPILATSAGLGGAGSFNFAAYTNAESRKRKPVVKSDESSPFEDGFYGSSNEEISKVSAKLKFKAGYQTAKTGQVFHHSNYVGGGRTARREYKVLSKDPAMRAGEKVGRVVTDTKRNVKGALDRIDVPTALAGAAGGAALSSPIYRKKEVKKSDDRSAFGIVHD